MGFQEQIEGKGISSFTISQNGKAILRKNNYCKTRTTISILTIIALFLATILIYYSYSETEFTVCKTKSCLKSAVSLMNCINETVDPCDDFYEFACGMFETNYPSYSDTEENSWITILSLKVKQKVKKFLNQKNEGHEPEAVHKTRMFYNACLNSMKDQAADSYDSLQNIWGKVNLNTEYLKDSVPLDIETILARVKAYFDMNIFFMTGIFEDPRNSSYSLLFIGEIEESNIFKNGNIMKINEGNMEESLPTFIENYNVLINRLLNRSLIHTEKLEVGDLTSTNHELNNFEEEFSKIIKNSSNFKQNIPELITLGQLQNLTDSIGNNFKFDWTLFLRQLFHDIVPEVYEQLTSENSNDFEILISNRIFFEKMFKLLSTTPKIIIKISILTRTLQLLNTKFPSATDVHSVSDHCFSITTELFGMVTGYSMINTLDNTSIIALTEMSDNIKWAFRKMVNEVDWMDNETKNATLRKLANTKIYYGYPSNYTIILNNLYQNVNVTNNHIDNLVSIPIFKAKSNWDYLVKQNDWNNIEWDVTPDQVNAYNYNAMNAFFMPAAILQDPLYHNGIQVLNYASTGSTIGHELSHNYDNTGRLYNELGNVVQWWTNNSFEEYTKRADCLVKYYNDMPAINYNDQEFMVDGHKTLDENIADIAGLKEAYFAYQRYVNIHGQEPRLPGMERYSPEQLFFLGYANQYCQYDTHGSQFDYADNHSPNVIRVRGTLSLLPEFSKVWSCPIGSPMNPNTKKCQIW